MQPDTLARIRKQLTKRRPKSGQVRGYNLATTLSKDLGMSVTEVRLGLNILHEKGELIAKDWHPQLGPDGMVTLALDVPENPAIEAWVTAMEYAGVDDPTDQAALFPLADLLAAFEPRDQAEIARCLLHMREAQVDRKGGSRYVASAQCLLGSSKLLDALPRSALRAFGIDPGLLDGPPGYIITAGPPKPACVILVENPQAMETAISVQGIDDVAWIATFGYGLSNRGSEQGNQLASLIEGARPLLHAVVRAGQPPSLRDLLAHDRVFFWGDLDLEGLRIYWRLKAQLPQLQISALYTPMMKMLESESTSHPYVNAVGKENQQAWECDDVEVSRLIKLCSRRGVDQESIPVTDFQQHARSSLCFDTQ